MDDLREMSERIHVGKDKIVRMEKLSIATETVDN